MFARSGLPMINRQFAETATQWPLGVEADAVDHCDAVIQWKSAEWSDKYGILLEDVDALIRLPVAVTVTGGGKDTFIVIDPTTEEDVKLVASSLVDRNGATQTWSLKRIEVREIARQGYRR